MCMLHTDHYSFPFLGWYLWAISLLLNDVYKLCITVSSSDLPGSAMGRAGLQYHLAGNNASVLEDFHKQQSKECWDQVCWKRGAHTLISQHVLPPIVPGICLRSGCESWWTCRKWALYSLIHVSLSDRFRPGGHSTLGSSRVGSWC